MMVDFEIKTWALQIVFGGDLKDKLSPPPLVARNSLVLESRVPYDQQLPLVIPPVTPKRNLRFPEGKNLPSLGPDGFLTPQARAQHLHAFANHELLAIEIMALMILKFPYAPEPFIKGLLSTIQDEQRHFSLYTQRLEELSCEFGCFPVNYFLWNICKIARSPLEFVTKMALTFEQANLDYALHFAKKFREAGDTQSAEILDQVFRDEISHVHFGLMWFDHWRPHQEDSWQEYLKALPKPLTPARAKGFDFCKSVRQKIGFEPIFIEQLEGYYGSKGRPPDVYWFNPEAEAELENGRHSFHPPTPFITIKDDFGVHLAFLTKSDDILVTSVIPSPEFKAELKKLGANQPEFVSNPPIELAQRKLGKFKPWGITNRSTHTARQWNLDLDIPLYDPKIHQTVTRKSWAKKQLLDYIAQINKPHKLYDDFYGTTLQHIDQFEDLASAIWKSSPALVIKSDFSCSGRGHKKLRAFSNLSAQDTHWLTKHLKSDHNVTVEPWFEKVADFSLQLEVGIHSSQPIKILGLTRFFTDHLGHYLGHYLGDLYDELPADAKLWFHQNYVRRELEDAAKFVATALLSQGYRGPVGIDALIFRKSGLFKIYPIVEINTRYTMGRIALILNKKISPKSRAKWLHLPSTFLNDPKRQKKLEDFLQKKSLPLTTPDLLDYLNCQGSLLNVSTTDRIESGAIPTSDIWRPHKSFSMVLAGQSLDRFNDLG